MATCCLPPGRGTSVSFAPASPPDSFGADEAVRGGQFVAQAPEHVLFGPVSLANT